MTIDNQIMDEKLQYDNNIISALSCGKIYIYENLTCEEILPTYQRQIIELIEQADFADSLLGKAFEKSRFVL